MYYIKYRPQKITEIDNVERRLLITKVFSNKKDIPHAFLLIGPKGTGKTSTARIIAKLLNCQKNVFAGVGSSIEPCGVCDNCLDLLKNRFLDVYELDGASHRGIDDIRALRDGVGYSPVKGRYKIYIIDEVHMLTKEAFNALLKTLEEPPSFVVFVLATTEPAKLPDTIVSRCINIVFNKASVEELTQSLIRVVEGEKLAIKPSVLTYIAKEANGSFRDGAKLLELAVRMTDLSLTKVQEVITSNTAGEPIELLQLLLLKKTDEVLKWIDVFDQAGGRAQWLVTELLRLLHDILLAKKRDENFTDLTKYKVTDITHLMKLLLDAYAQLKYSPIDSLPLLLVAVNFGASEG